VGSRVEKKKWAERVEEEAKTAIDALATAIDAALGCIDLWLSVRRRFAAADRKHSLLGRIELSLVAMMSVRVHTCASVSACVFACVHAYACACVGVRMCMREEVTDCVLVVCIAA